jgi:hypothetical protein
VSNFGQIEEWVLFGNDDKDFEQNIRHLRPRRNIVPSYLQLPAEIVHSKPFFFYPTECMPVKSSAD